MFFRGTRGRRWRLAATAATAAVAAASVGGLPAFAVTPPGQVWQRHAASLSAGHPIVLSIKRASTETCVLAITSPIRQVKSWRYAAGSGLLQFGITPPSNVLPGSWTFTTSCTPLRSRTATTATTTLRVNAPRGGRTFITGAGSPFIQVPVGSGVVAPKAAPAARAGKGGDPGDDYPYKNLTQDSQFDPWGEYVRECTSFVAWALHSRNHFDMPFYDDAKNWGTRAAARGFRVDRTPSVGAVAWSNAGYYGHVAWVLDTPGNSVVVEEYNERGDGTYDRRTVLASSFQYIHFTDLPAAPLAPPTPTQPPAQPAPQPVAATVSETAGGVAHTWTNPANAGGNEGPSLGGGQAVAIACKLTGFRVADGNVWWYQIASSPWNRDYYVSADAFYNNGRTSGSLYNTPFVDTAVPDCTGAAPTPVATTYAETPGGVTHTWTNPANAGGSQGPSISTGQTVQIACRLTGFVVADGDNWWYRIASSPWSSAYYASADAFYNNGATSGSLHGTPFVDAAVPGC